MYLKILSGVSHFLPISYYKTGEIDKIKQRWFDGEGNLLRERIIKHFRDGRQPKIIG